MKYKNGLIFICFIICLFCIASVCASDVNETVIANENQVELITDKNNNEIITYETQLNDESVSIDSNDFEAVGTINENDLSATPGTFTDLANDIARAGNELKLNKDYIYSSEDSIYNLGITLDKKITIDGNGHIIDGNKQSRVFLVEYDSIVLKNIIFKNCGPSERSYKLYGGAIKWSGNYGVLSNCRFIDCFASTPGISYTADAFGGAVYWEGENGFLTNCYFNNCSALAKALDKPESSNQRIFTDANALGGAIYWSGPNGVLRDCYFDKCTALASPATSIAQSNGGAVYWSGSSGVLCYNSFVECISSSESSYQYSYTGSYSYGGAVYLQGWNCTLYGSDFYKCGVSSKASSAKIPSNFGDDGATRSYTYGGAVYWFGSDGYLSDCYFDECTALSEVSSIRSDEKTYGGAVYWSGNKGSLSNSEFVDCQSFDNTDAYEIIYWPGNYGSLVSCNFYNTLVFYAVDWKGSDGSIVNCMSNGTLVSGEGYTIYYESAITLIMEDEIKFGETAILYPIVSNGATGNIKILVNGIYKSSIKVGESYSLSNLNVGEHTIMVMYEGDVHYNSCIDIKVLKVNRVPTTPLPKKIQKTTISLKNVKIKKSAKKLVLHATLKQGKTPLKSKKIIFKFNGKKYTAKTNKNGVAKVTIKKKILKKLKVGKKVKYQASYGKITVKKSVKVKK